MTSIFAIDSNSVSVAAPLLRLVLGYAAEHGLGVAELLPAALADLDLEAADARVPYPLYAGICEALSDRLRDPDLGLHMGERVKPGHLGALGYVLMSCRSLREALDRVQRYSGLVVNAHASELVVANGECRRYWRSRLRGGEQLGRLQDEMNMAVWITLARWLTGRESLVPIGVAFAYPEPECIDEYVRLFGCRPQFAAPESVLVFPEAWLDLTLPQASTDIRDAMDAVCVRMLERLRRAQEPGVLQSVRAAISERFRHGTPELVDVAATVGIAPVALLRMLAQDGGTFRCMVDRLRRELALDYLADDSLALLEVAFLLGFSEQSAFQRAFKRWTGQTPGAYRAALRVGDSLSRR